MSPKNAKQLVAISALVSFGVLFLASLSKQEGAKLPTSREWIGLAIAFLMMSILADLGMPLGGGLALIAMVAMLLRKGTDALAFGLGKVNAKPTKPTATPQPPAGSPITLAAMQAAGARAQANLRPPRLPQRPPGQAGGGRMGRTHYPTTSA